MATKKFYLTNTNTTLPVGPTSRWNDATLTGVSELAESPAGAVATASRSENVNAANRHVLLHRFVTPPMTQAGTLESSGLVADLITAIYTSGGDSRTSWAIWVMTPQGGVRGTLYAGSGGSAWPTAISGFAQTAPSSLATPVACQAGDRVVVELGFDGRTANTTSYTGYLRYGGTGTDLANGDTGTNAQNRPSHITFTGPNSSDLWLPVEQPEPDGRRNQSPNPSAANSLDGWWHGGSGTRVTGLGSPWPRPTAGRVTFSGGAWTEYLASPLVATAGGEIWSAVYTVMVSRSQTVQCGFVLRDANGNYVSGQNNQTPALIAGTPTTIRLTGTMPTGAVQVQASIDGPNAQSGDQFTMSAVRLERVTDSELAYRDGDSTGWVWDGTPGDSTSRAGTLVLPEPGRFLLAC